MFLLTSWNDIFWLFYELRPRRYLVIPFQKWPSFLFFFAIYWKSIFRKLLSSHCSSFSLILYRILRSHKLYCLPSFTYLLTIFLIPVLICYVQAPSWLYKWNCRGRTFPHFCKNNCFAFYSHLIPFEPTRMEAFYLIGLTFYVAWGVSCCQIIRWVRI